MTFHDVNPQEGHIIRKASTDGRTRVYIYGKGGLGLN